MIPAYNPSDAIIHLVSEIKTLCRCSIVVVNDGSSDKCNYIFKQLKSLSQLVILNHKSNLGKGQALKTGFSYIINTMPEVTGIITADADGQHSPQDIIRTLNESRYQCGQSNSLLLGARAFNGKVPFRSRIGNAITEKIFQLVTKIPITDTQTGLRYLSTDLANKCLSIESNGYEFETEMLLLATREKCMIKQIDIETIYIDDNSSSHFNPFRDSIKIYWTFLRFTGISISSALIDYLIFYLILLSTDSTMKSFIVARVCSAFYNYTMSKRIVFKSDGEGYHSIVKYVFLAIILLISSMILTQSLIGCDISTMYAKLIAECLLFISSFFIQRFFVFRKN
ncbi:bifunctional glycosyltransferase family 2/GtrA family protein [Vibrio sp. Of14-4]|uniref:bifunctional glycosyltransferase family 2/GtrA family protein n=1 Tax=Vibrio sp. Of14-4 TaxID=2724878 RepID=UPI001EF32E40|nr:bifunctional glycosyltransferase family 2/GtrA family protein [Vibrio sp. Of14-4]MCG7490991.1 bifunctional glycosyltransferase family 2/GtrA family protein [Vibrio sp. Of14-4]